MYGSYQASFEEVSWGAFVDQYLSRGVVERLEVINRQWVRVVLREGSAQQKIPWFSVGSIDAFERNVESMQRELGFDHRQQVQIVYRSQLNGCVALDC